MRVPRFASVSLCFVLVIALGVVGPRGAWGEDPPKDVPLKPSPKAPVAPVAPAAPAAAAEKPAKPAWPSTLGDPRAAEVPLPASGGWDAYLLLDNQRVGVWAVKSFQVFEQFGCPEVVGIDDRGRMKILTGYSGKWAPLEAIGDGSWLGGLEHGDGDPRVPGLELYTGSERGNLYQVIAHENGILDSRRIAFFESRSVNQLVLADLDATTPGEELIVFTWPGGLYRANPTGPAGTFEVQELLAHASRVRQAVVLPPVGGRPREVATVSRDGRLEIVTLTPQGAHVEIVHQEAMGMGRIAMSAPGGDRPVVLYTTLDDGRILRHQRGGDFRWTTETIYLGPQGPRGIATGRFFADPTIEAVAIYGYSQRVEMLSRTPGKPWTVETIFEDPDMGHWLSVAEIDGRNATDEIVASGFGGRIVELVRPPGYGRKELAVPRDAAE